jgi:hypothetical protein
VPLCVAGAECAEGEKLGSPSGSVGEQSFRKKLLASISGQDGKCVICNVLNAREIDHMRPELKTLCFGDKYSIKNLEAEVARNTVDGKVQLQGLCCECHANKSKKSKRSAEETAKRNPKRTFVKEYIQNYKIEKKSCEYEKCCRRGDLCTADNVSSFELDHHHTMSCPCDECKVNPSLQKKFKISDYARNYPIGNKTKEEMRKELDTELAKCRMLHRECHQKHTIEQLKTNHKLREKRKAEEAKALADVDPTKTKRRRTS